MKIQEKLEQFKRDELQLLLEQCTGPQQNLFNRLYPAGVPDDKLVNAIKLCERTLEKNRK